MDRLPVITDDCSSLVMLGKGEKREQESGKWRAKDQIDPHYDVIIGKDSHSGTFFNRCLERHARIYATLGDCRRKKSSCIDKALEELQRIGCRFVEIIGEDDELDVHGSAGARPWESVKFRVLTDSRKVRESVRRKLCNAAKEHMPEHLSPFFAPGRSSIPKANQILARNRASNRKRRNEPERSGIDTEMKKSRYDNINSDVLTSRKKDRVQHNGESCGNGEMSQNVDRQASDLAGRNPVDEGPLSVGDDSFGCSLSKVPEAYLLPRIEARHEALKLKCRRMEQTIRQSSDLYAGVAIRLSRVTEALERELMCEIGQPRGQNKSMGLVPDFANLDSIHLNAIEFSEV
jgi:hypothetical protein